MAFTLYLESLQSRAVAEDLARNPQALKDARQNSAAALHRFLLQTIQVEQDPKKHAFATVRTRSSEPEAAAHFLALLHHAADNHIRQLGLAQSQQAIAALQALPSAGADVVVGRALSEERVVQAAALSKGPFAAQILDEPAAGADPISSLFRSLVSALILGLAAGMALAVSLQWLRWSA